MDDLGGLIHTFFEEHWDGTALRSRFRILTCAISLGDHARARAKNQFLRSAEAICVDVCVSNLFPVEDPAGLLLYFDRGERFMKEVEQVWNKDRRKRPPLGENARRIKAITQADSRDVLPLQAANLMVWSTNQGVLMATERGAPRANITFSGGLITTTTWTRSRRTTRRTENGDGQSWSG